MNNSNLCRVDCYGILKSLIDKVLQRKNCTYHLESSIYRISQVVFMIIF